MKALISIFMMAALMTGFGCWMNTTDSPQGGTISKDEEFSITVPSGGTVKQGADQAVSVTLNRGADFKRDVLLEVQAEGISVTPVSILVKASELSAVQYKIAAATDAALGEFRVYITATPASGKPTTAVFTVKVVAP